jgi:calreticulin
LIDTCAAGWEDNWVASKNKGPSSGDFKWSAGKYYNDAEEDKGIQTSQDARFYGLSAKFNSFSNKGKSLIIQVLCRTALLSR